MENVSNKLMEVAMRIREMREIAGLTSEQMAEKTDVTLDIYLDYEAGKCDLPFTFIHKCSLVFGIGITDILEGHSARLSSYTVTRRGEVRRPQRRMASRSRISPPCSVRSLLSRIG